MAVSLLPPPQPKSGLQRLTTTLRIENDNPISTNSKASGVFPSSRR